jgi:hypothetical protein
VLIIAHARLGRPFHGEVAVEHVVDVLRQAPARPWLGLPPAAGEWP